MVEFERRVGPKGQIVIPKEIRRATGLRPEMKVLVTLEGNRIIVVREKEKKLSDWLEEQVSKDGKALQVNNFEKLHGEELAERWTRVKHALSRR